MCNGSGHTHQGKTRESSIAMKLVESKVIANLHIAVCPH